MAKNLRYSVPLKIGLLLIALEVTLLIALQYLLAEKMIDSKVYFSGVISMLIIPFYCVIAINMQSRQKMFHNVLDRTVKLVTVVSAIIIIGLWYLAIQNLVSFDLLNLISISVTLIAFSYNITIDIYSKTKVRPSKSDISPHQS